jgi:outer membrane lipoprotein-sorting protein
MKKIILTAVFFVTVILNINPVYSGETSVSDIVEKANKAAYYEGDNGRAEVNMVITDRQGRERNREFIILRMDVIDGREQKYYVYFRKPSDVRDMVYMVWKHLDRDDDRWLYLPALDLVRRVAASDKRSSFVGSDFLYEDVSGRSIDLDTHEIVESPEQDLYKIKNTPKEGTGVDFKYYYIWIDKKNFMPVKAEYYDERDKLYRIVEALEVKDIEGHPTVTRSKASNLVSGSSTVLEFSNVKYDTGLTDDIFTERYLRRPPMDQME